MRETQKPHSRDEAHELARNVIDYPHLRRYVSGDLETLARAVLSLEEQLEAAQYQADENRQIIESERDYIRQLKEQLEAAREEIEGLKVIAKLYAEQSNPAEKLAPGYGVKSVLDEINSNPASKPLCPACGHRDHSDREACDVPVCGDGCCHCPCYGPDDVNQDGEARDA